MIFGMPPLLFAHVLISLVAIFTGFIVMYGLLTARPFDGWTALFLATTIATSATGFLLPFDHFMPSHALGILSLAVLTIAVVARYTFHLTGAWSWLYVVGAVTAQYFDVFVLVAQAFQKLPALRALAPTQSDPPFLVTQLIVMAAFVILGIVAVKRRHNGPASAH